MSGVALFLDQQQAGIEFLSTSNYHQVLNYLKWESKNGYELILVLSKLKNSTILLSVNILNIKPISNASIVRKAWALYRRSNKTKLN